MSETLRVIRLAAEPKFQCSCGEIVTAARAHIGKEARCPGCGKAISLTLKNLAKNAIQVPDFFCMCCGYRTFNSRPPGTYEICVICGWEDDPVQAADPDLAGGANHLSLRENQAAFLRGGAGSAQVIGPYRDDLVVEIQVDRDPKWRPPAVDQDTQTP